MGGREAETVRCSKCGVENAARRQGCYNCGTLLHPKEEVVAAGDRMTYSPPVAAHASNRITLFIALGVLVVSFIAVGFYWLGTRRQETRGAAPPQSSAPRATATFSPGQVPTAPAPEAASPFAAQPSTIAPPQAPPPSLPQAPTTPPSQPPPQSPHPPTESSSLGTKARALVDLFSALDSRLDVGMVYRDYGDRVGELKAALDRFARQPGAGSHGVYWHLKSAFVEYDIALGVWRYYITSEERHSFFSVSSPYGPLLIREYGVTPTDFGPPRGPPGPEDLHIYLPDALSAIWSRAHKHVEAAQGAL